MPAAHSAQLSAKRNVHSAPRRYDDRGPDAELPHAGDGPLAHVRQKRRAPQLAGPHLSQPRINIYQLFANFVLGEYLYFGQNTNLSLVKCIYQLRTRC